MAIPPPRDTRDPSTNLPVQLTTFIGREREVAEVRELLLRNRLLTLTGAGGVGKTRLALQVANELLAVFSDGMCFVELAPLNDPTLVAGAVTSSVGVKEQPGRSAHETLGAYLQTRSILLVFDNCEHLLPASAELVDYLLRRCPDLQVLATSRERPGVPGETAWRVPSQSVPDRQASTGTDEIAACEAVRLFVDRARSAERAFVLGDHNASAVAQLCERLDGIPLAIELAAARAPVLAPEQIVARLDDRFRLLVGGSRTAPSRQQTLRATVAWSYELLQDSERALFSRLSVFAGGFTLEAAEAVCSGDPVAPGDVLDVLAGLVDKSLVVVDSANGEAARYGMLETLRQYGWERLTQRGEPESLQQRHADYLLSLTQQAELALLGSTQQGVWLDRLEREHGNFRAALRWAIDRNRGETGVRLAAGVWRLWYVRGWMRRRWRDCGSRGLSLDQAIDEATKVEAREVTSRGTGRVGLLTQREQEVASLVSRGLSNREIAEALVVSVRTVEAHLTHMLNKLDMRSRSQLATWALEHGLRR